MYEQRQDWLMRQFIDSVLALSLPMDEKQLRMQTRGVPVHVQQRVLGLLANEEEEVGEESVVLH